MFTRLAIASAASMLLASAARAQGSACDQLKATLAARIDPSIRGFSLDTVPGSTPVPAGAKVIGTCEGGAYKVLFRRSGGTLAPSGAASVALQVPAPAASSVAAAATPRSTPVQPRAASRPAAGSAPVPETAASALPRPLAGAREPVASMATPASATAAKTADVVEPAASLPTPAPPDAAPVDSTPFAQLTGDFLRRYWYAFAALALLITGPALWSWVAYRRAYDASGLPRGPRIR